MEQAPPRERIMGRENEFLPIDPNGTDDESRYWVTHIQTYDKFFTRPFDGMITSANTAGSFDQLSVFLINGAKWYRDQDMDAEYATPECLGPRQTVVYDLASQEFMIRALAHKTKEANAKRGDLPPREVRLHHRLVDYDKGHPKGTHENYYVKRPEDVSLGDVARQIEGFLIGRTVFNGAGMVKEIEGIGPRVVPAQKAQFVVETIGKTRNGDLKPWVVDRDEQHNGHDKRYSRLQVCGGDANMSPYANYFTLASTSIALRLVENGILPEYTVVNVNEATRRAANDYNNTTKLFVSDESENWKQWQPVDLFDQHIDLAEKHQHRGILSPQEQAFLPQIRQDIDRFKAVGPSSLDRAADWVTKQVLMEERGINKLGKMQMYDLLFDMLVAGGTISDEDKDIKLTDRHRIGLRLREAGYFRPLPDPITSEEVEHAVFHAPKETRAGNREDLMRALTKFPNALSVSWESLKFRIQTGELHVKMYDPYGALSATDKMTMRRALNISENMLIEVANESDT